MAKRKKQGRTTPLQWIIRILVLVIFVVALTLSVRHLLKYNQLRRAEEELEKDKAQLEQQNET